MTGDRERTLSETAEGDTVASAGVEATSRRRLAWVYLVGGAIGLVAAFILTLEKLAELRDPNYLPSCSINPVISCGSVMDSDQAGAFGFPNPLIGIVAFAALTTIGVVMLSGYKPPTWFLIGVQLSAIFGVVFLHWLIYASLYSIHALCPYCLAVWVVTIPIFWYTTLDSLLRIPRTRNVAVTLSSVHTGVLALWFSIIAGLILEAFWDYWITLV